MIAAKQVRAAPLLASVLLGSASFGAAPVNATHSTDANTAAPVLEEVVVSAEKRREPLQDVPISVTAVNGEQLAAAGVFSTEDLSLVTSGLEYGTQAAYGQPFLRGIGTTANGPGVENPVALYVDGVYYGASIGTVLTLDSGSIQQIEVDKGPQGTLFGRNATGGLIQVTTRDPTQKFEGNSGVGYGNYQTGDASIYLAGGVSERLAANVDLHINGQGTGYGINSFTGQNVNYAKDISARSKWIWTDSEATTVKFLFDYEHQTFAQAYVPAPGTTPLGGPPYTGSPQGMGGYFQPDGRLAQGGTSVQVHHDFSGVQFLSLTAYRQSSVYEAFDGGLVTDPLAALNIIINERHQQVTQEFQFLSPDDSPIHWAAGAFFYWTEGKSDPLVATSNGLFQPFVTFDIYSTQKAISPAVYGQVTKEILPGTNLTAGLRYTTERRTFYGYNVNILNSGASAPAGSDYETQTFSKLTWRLALDHRFTPDLMTYVSYNRGFKSGGFNDYLVPTQPYQPETLDAYEIGAKSDLLAHRLEINPAVFLYRYKNLQSVQYPFGIQVITNGAEAQLYGLDLDVKALIATGFTITMGLEALHDEFTSFPDAQLSIPVPGGGTQFTTFNAKGKHLGLAPSFTANISPSWTLPRNVFPSGWGSMTLNATYAENSGWYAEPDNRLHQPAYGLLSSEIAWALPNQHCKLMLWGRNLLNSQYTVALASQANGDFAIYAPPRTYGFKFQVTF